MPRGDRQAVGSAPGPIASEEQETLRARPGLNLAGRFLKKNLRCIAWCFGGLTRWLEKTNVRAHAGVFTSPPL